LWDSQETSHFDLFPGRTANPEGIRQLTDKAEAPVPISPCLRGSSARIGNAPPPELYCPPVAVLKSYQSRERRHWNGRAMWGDLAMCSSQWATEQVRESLNRGMDILDAFDTASSLAASHNAELASRLVDRIAALLLSPNRRDRTKPTVVVEISVGTGALALNLVPFCAKHGLHYCGLDCSREMLKHARRRLKSHGVDTSGLQLGNALALQGINEESVLIAIWGRLGLHLSTRQEDGQPGPWAIALSEVKRIVSPGGYFVLYESLAEKQTRTVRQKPWTELKTLACYGDALESWPLVESIDMPFCGDIYTYAVWQKPDA
jgi:ubiquinone/menaquinone biosynthesis C-methylase UbiE